MEVLPRRDEASFPALRAASAARRSMSFIMPKIANPYKVHNRIFITTMNTWQRPGRAIILASESPRRKAIMAQLGFTFKTVAPALIDEAAYIDAGRLAASLIKLAKAKALSAAEKNPEALVLGADTVV